MDLGVSLSTFEISHEYTYLERYWDSEEALLAPLPKVDSLHWQLEQGQEQVLQTLWYVFQALCRLLRRVEG